MVLRTKTVEYGFLQNEASLAAATRFDFAAETLYLPETTSRTFRSVIVQITFRSDAIAAVSLTSWLIGIKLGAVAFNDVTITDTMANTGEHESHLFTRDVTSYFTTNFGAAATQTCQVGLNIGAMITANHTAKVIITYESEEQQTRVKTVKIPLESFVGALTTTLAEMGTNQVPLLNTFLPESTKTFRRIWFEVSGNESNDGVTDHQLSLALDVEAADNDAIHQNELASDVWYFRLWQRNTMTTSAVHAFMAATTVLAGAVHNHLTVLLCVTYEYDHTNSTTIINSIQLPWTLDQTQGRTVAGDQSLLQKKFYIEEPATITLVQSGVLLVWGGASLVSGFAIACGSQADRTYTTNIGGASGQFSMIQRIDSGSAQGAGITLARGLNTFTLETWNSDTTIDFVSPITGLLYLNYTSGKATGGDGAHNHTTLWSFLDHIDTAIIAYQAESAAVAPVIPETSYWVTAMGFILNTNQVPAGGAGSALSAVGVELVAARASGERGGDGWETLYSNHTNWGDPELGVSDVYIDACGHFDRYPNEQTDRLAIETTRIYRYYVPILQSFWSNILMSLTYHSITVTKSGTVSGSGGGTVNIGFWRKVNDIAERLDTTSRVGNGAFSITWYDDTELVFAEGRESATLVGRSDDGAS